MAPPLQDWQIESFGSRDCARLAELVRESEREGVRFLTRLVDEWSSGANRFDRPGEALFVASTGGRVVAVCGLNVDPYRSDPGIARLRHVYVLPSARRRGVGRDLVDHSLRHATGSGFSKVRLRTDTVEAARFYEARGFAACAGTASATHERVPR